MTMEPKYRLTLLALKDEAPPAVRLRMLLKRALRAYRLRCLQVEEITGDPTASIPVDDLAGKEPAAGHGP
jgi:hypothetical protein